MIKYRVSKCFWYLFLYVIIFFSPKIYALEISADISNASVVEGMEASIDITAVAGANDQTTALSGGFCTEFGSAYPSISSESDCLSLYPSTGVWNICNSNHIGDGSCAELTNYCAATITVQPSGGDAEAPSDYNDSVTVFEFDAGNSESDSYTYNISTVDDALFEEAESVQFQVDIDTNGHCEDSFDSPISLALEITDNDQKPTVSLSLPEVVELSVDEASSSIAISIVQTPLSSVSDTDCEAKVVLDDTSLNGAATISNTEFTQSGDAIITPSVPRSNQDVTETVSATLSVNTELCAITAPNPVNVQVFIEAQPKPVVKMTLPESVIIGLDAVSGALPVTINQTPPVEAGIDCQAKVVLDDGTLAGSATFNETELTQSGNATITPSVPRSNQDVTEAVSATLSVNTELCVVAAPNPASVQVTIKGQPKPVAKMSLPESVLIDLDDTSGQLPVTITQTPGAEDSVNCQAEVVLDAASLSGVATMDTTIFTQTGNATVTPSLPRATEDVIKTISATLSVNEQLCSIEGINPANVPVTIKGIQPEDPIIITPDFVTPDLVILEGAGDYSVAKIEYALSRAIPDGEQCDIDYQISVVAGTAVQGTHINAPAENGTTVITSADNDETYVANILDSGGGDGDKTVTLQAVLTNNSENILCQLGGANASQQVTIRKSFTVRDDVATPLAGGLAINKTSINEGESAIVTLSLAEDVQARLAARSVENCQVAAEWTVAGSATETDYTFDAPEVITYTAAEPETAVVLSALTDDEPEETESLDISVALSGTGDNPCPVSDRATSSLSTILLQNVDTVADRKNPEELVQSTCEVLSNLSDEDKTTADTKYFNTECLPDKDLRLSEPEEIEVQGTALLIGANQHLRNMNARLNQLRMNGGERDLDVSGASFTVQGTTIPTIASSALLGGAAGDEVSEILESSRWGVFANGDYNFGGKDRGNDTSVASGDRNFDFNSKGLAIGADYRFPGEKFIAGAALGYRDFASDFTSESGGTDLNGTNFSVYGTYLLNEQSYFDFVVGYGKNSIETRRPVNNDGSSGAIETFAIGKPDSQEWTVSIGGGYEFNQAEWILTPYGRLDYIQGSIDAFREIESDSSASAATFHFDEQRADSLTSSVGIRANRVINTSSGVFVPQASVEWRHEFKDRSAISGQSTYLIDNGGRLNLLPGFEETHVNKGFDKNYFNITAGVSAVFPKGRSAFVNVESRVGDSSIQDNAIKAGFRWEF